jgi:hypothetical protein
MSRRRSSRNRVRTFCGWWRPATSPTTQRIGPEI